MGLSRRTSSWSVEEVLKWVQEQHPEHMSRLQKAIIQHDISGRALLRLKEYHLELLGVEDEEQQQEILQDLLLLRVQEEVDELGDICSGCQKVKSPEQKKKKRGAQKRREVFRINDEDEAVEEVKRWTETGNGSKWALRRSVNTNRTFTDLSSPNGP